MLTEIKHNAGTDKIVVLYGTDGTPIGFSLNETVYTYIKNLQGDVIRILDTNGNTVVEYNYDPWGVPTITGDAELAAINPCSYRCYDYDEESGYYYLQSRYYNPETGRFLNADETEYLGASGTVLGYNLFAYCENNPVNNYDPLGNIKINIKWLWLAVDGIIWFIPALFAISKIWKSVSTSWSKLNALGVKLISFGKQLFRKLDDRLYCCFARESSYRIVRTLGALSGMVTVFYSIGTIVQYVVDILDGKWDGYLDTKNIRPKLDLTRDY